MGAKDWFEHPLDKTYFCISRQRGGYYGGRIFRCDVSSGIREVVGWLNLGGGEPCCVWPDCSPFSRCHIADEQCFMML